MNIDKTLKNRKNELLSYFRSRAEEFLSEIKLTYGNSQYKEQASAINKALIETKGNIVANILQNTERDKWTNQEKLESILMVTYTIDKLKISGKEREQLKKYNHKVWGLVTSGEIKLESDLHFIFNNQKIVADFKSGFGSNEKGNVNRLLLVASIYQNLEDNYKCVIRAVHNNHYFQTLKNSGIWNAFSGLDAYTQMKKYSGFDNKRWIDTNVNWESDFERETIIFLKKNNLHQYLIW